MSCFACEPENPDADIYICDECEARHRRYIRAQIDAGIIREPPYAEVYVRDADD